MPGSNPGSGRRSVLARLAALHLLIALGPAAAGPPNPLPNASTAAGLPGGAPAALTWAAGELRAMQFLPREDQPLGSHWNPDIWGTIPQDRSIGLPGDSQPLASCGAEFAGPQDGAAIDLHQAVEAALCRNPQTRQAWASLQSQGAQLGLARSPYLPSFSLGENRSRDATDTKYSDGSRFPTPPVWATGQTASLNWVLWDMGTRRSNLNQAKRSFEAALASEDAAVQSVFGATAQAYYEAWSAQAAVEAAAEAERAAAETLDAARERLRLGAVSRADELQARAAVAQARMARIRAEGNREIATGNLAAMMGLDARSRLSLMADPALAHPESAAIDVAEFRREMDALMDDAMASNPGVHAAQAQLAAAAAKRNATIAEGLPSISLSANRYLNGRPNTQLSANRTYELLVTLQFQMPLFEGFARNYRIRDAQAQVDARQADLLNARLQASLDIWRQYQTANVESRAFAAAGEIVDAAAGVLEAAQARLEAGAVDLLEVVNAQKDLANARQERIRALAAWRGARLKLLAGLGRLGFWALEDSASDAQR